MTHVGLGMPVATQEKINPNNVSSVDDLVSTIIQFENPVPRSVSVPKVSSASKVPVLSPSTFSSLCPRSLCPYCKSKGFERFHRESDCFTKFKDDRDKSKMLFPRTPKNSAINTFDVSALQEAIDTEAKN